MICMKGEIVIKQPLEVVFDFVADARNEPLYNPHIHRAEKISVGPIGPGTFFTNETRSMGTTTGWTIEIMAYERPRHLASSIHSSVMNIYGNFMFDSVEGASRMRWSWEIKPHGLFRLAGPWLKRNGQRLEERNWENLKYYLEARDYTRVEY